MYVCVCVRVRVRMCACARACVPECVGVPKRIQSSMGKLISKLFKNKNITDI